MVQNISYMRLGCPSYKLEKVQMRCYIQLNHLKILSYVNIVYIPCGFSNQFKTVFSFKGDLKIFVEYAKCGLIITYFDCVFI